MPPLRLLLADNFNQSGDSGDKRGNSEDDCGELLENLSGHVAPKSVVGGFVVTDNLCGTLSQGGLSIARSGAAYY